jgi:hypothetical protein
VLQTNNRNKDIKKVKMDIGKKNSCKKFKDKVMDIMQGHVYEKLSSGRYYV